MTETKTPYLEKSYNIDKFIKEKCNRLISWEHSAYIIKKEHLKKMLLEFIEDLETFINSDVPYRTNIFNEIKAGIIKSLDNE